MKSLVIVVSLLGGGIDFSGIEGQYAHTIPKEASGTHTPKYRVVFLSSSACVPCIERKARLVPEFDALQKAGWKISTTPDSHIQVVNLLEEPEYIKYVDSSGIPSLVCINQDTGGVERRLTNSDTIDRWSLGWLLKGYSEKPEVKQVSPQNDEPPEPPVNPNPKNVVVPFFMLTPSEWEQRKLQSTVTPMPSLKAQTQNTTNCPTCFK